MEESRVLEMIKQNNQHLLSQMSDLISTSINNLKRPADEASTGQIIKEIKRIRNAETRPVFRKMSNEDQYKAATKTLEYLEDAKDSLESKDVQKAQQAIEEGIVTVKERQKLILLADQSKYGWNTVKEYKQHELAENSEDEKKIYKAEARAARRSRRNLSGRSLSNHRSVSTSSTVSSQQSAIPTIISARGSSDRGALASPKPSPGTCFACGKSGHWRSSCPLNQPSTLAPGKQ